VGGRSGGHERAGPQRPHRVVVDGVENLAERPVDFAETPLDQRDKLTSRGGNGPGCFCHGRRQVIDDGLRIRVGQCDDEMLERVACVSAVGRCGHPELVHAPRAGKIGLVRKHHDQSGGA